MNARSMLALEAADRALHGRSRAGVEEVMMSQRPFAVGTTRGGDEREPRSLSAPLLRFELVEEAARLRAEQPYAEGDRNARTLAKVGAFRLVLVAFRSGAVFDESDQRGSVALQVLEGRVALRVDEEATEIGEAEVAVVAPEHPWTAVALADGILLVQGWSQVVAWSGVPLSELLERGAAIAHRARRRSWIGRPGDCGWSSPTSARVARSPRSIGVDRSGPRWG